MIIGDPSVFAIESQITKAYQRPSFLAIGFFVIHLCGTRYGVRDNDATLLACSFDEVKRRVSARGTHLGAGVKDYPAGVIADAMRIVCYGETARYPPNVQIPACLYEKREQRGHRQD